MSREQQPEREPYRLEQLEAMVRSQARALAIARARIRELEEAMRRRRGGGRAVLPRMPRRRPPAAAIIVPWVTVSGHRRRVRGSRRRT